MPRQNRKDTRAQIPDKNALLWVWERQLVSLESRLFPASRWPSDEAAFGKLSGFRIEGPTCRCCAGLRSRVSLFADIIKSCGPLRYYPLSHRFLYFHFRVVEYPKRWGRALPRNAASTMATTRVLRYTWITFCDLVPNRWMGTSDVHVRSTGDGTVHRGRGGAGTEVNFL